MAGCAHIEKSSWQYEVGKEAGRQAWKDRNASQAWKELRAETTGTWYSVRKTSDLSLQKTLAGIEGLCAEYAAMDGNDGIGEGGITEELCRKWVLSTTLMPVSYSPRKAGGPLFSTTNDYVSFPGEGLFDPDGIDSNAAIDEYFRRGFDVTYYNPRLYGFWREPETFVLTRRTTGQEGEDRLEDDLDKDIYVIFSGSETYNDWTANFFGSLKAAVIRDDFYLPGGQWAVRSRVHNLVRTGFVKVPDEEGASRASVLARHLDRYGPGWREEEKLDVYIIGHSQGAAHAQMAAFILHGFCSPRKGGVIEDCEYAVDASTGSSRRTAREGEIGRYRNWPFSVEGVFGYAPPYIIARDSLCAKDIDVCPDHWASAIEKYGIDDRTVMVIRNDDPVPAAWKPGKKDFHDINMRQYGHLFRIGRMGGLTYIGKDVWRDFNRPHFSLDYCAGVMANLSAGLERAGSDPGRAQAEDPLDSTRLCSNGSGALPTIQRDQNGVVVIRP